MPKTRQPSAKCWRPGLNAGHIVARVYEDQGTSGAKGRDQRPAFDAILKAAVRREINMIAVWSSDRLGRSQAPRRVTRY
jgi:DNA invertase Pin-like site-specific DNA recombinase